MPCVQPVLEIFYEHDLNDKVFVRSVPSSAEWLAFGFV
jgi:hypothetical protein